MNGDAPQPLQWCFPFLMMMRVKPNKPVFGGTSGCVAKCVWPGRGGGGGRISVTEALGR